MTSLAFGRQGPRGTGAHGGQYTEFINIGSSTRFDLRNDFEALVPDLN